MYARENSHFKRDEKKVHKTKATTKTNMTNFLCLLVVLGCTLHFTSSYHYSRPDYAGAFSLVATDSKTRQVGGVGALCSFYDAHKRMYVSAPNRSVLHIHGEESWRYIVYNVAEEMMEENSTFNETFESMNEAQYSWEERKDDRQYIMADFESSAAYTGSYVPNYTSFGYETRDIAMKHGENDRYHAHSGGYFLEKGTVAALQEGFGKNTTITIPFMEEEEEIDDLAGRLMSALWAVYYGVGLGDATCREQYGLSSSGAYLHVDNPDGTILLHINIEYNGEDPIVSVLRAFSAWRSANVSSDVKWEYDNFDYDDDYYYDDDYEDFDGMGLLEVLALLFLLFYCMCAHWYKYCHLKR